MHRSGDQERLCGPGDISGGFEDWQDAQRSAEWRALHVHEQKHGERMPWVETKGYLLWESKCRNMVGKAWMPLMPHRQDCT